MNNKRNNGSLGPSNMMLRNKTTRIILFYVVNAILIISIILSIIFINFPYNTMAWILPGCILGLIDIQAFYIHVERYPLNDYSEYKIVLNEDELEEKNGYYVIRVTKKGYMYYASLKDKELVFNMKGCWFPRTVIKAYLGRQFIMMTINERELVSDYMQKNARISKKCDKYANVKIIFIKEKGKLSESYLIKSKKAKMSILMRAINGHNLIVWGYGNVDRYYVEVDESIFVSRKR